MTEQGRHNDSKLVQLAARQIAVLLPMMFLLAGVLLQAQDAPPVAAIAEQSAATPAPHFTFDVATIKPSDPNDRGFGVSFNDTRYSVINFSLAEIVLRAYFPYSKGNRVIGAPVWAEKENYDIVAQVDEADAPSWLKLTISQQLEFVRPMMQKLLAERCKLVVHTVPSQVDGYALVVGKRGSHLQPAQHRDTFPDGIKDIDSEGGKILTPNRFKDNTAIFFDATINDLIKIIGGPYTVIVDRTDLTGRYDFTIHRLERPRDLDGKPLPDPLLSDLWDISDTGLEIKPAKIPSQNLVVDHIERPSPN